MATAGNGIGSSHRHFDFWFSFVCWVSSALRSLRISHFQNARQSFEVIGHRLERQFQLVARQPQIPHSAVVLPLLPVGKDPFDAAAHPALAPVLSPVVLGELDVVRAFLGDLTGDAVLPQPGVIGFRVVGFVRVKTGAVGRGDARQQVRVVGIGRTDDRGPNELMLAIAANVGFVAVVALAVFARVTRLGIRSLSSPRGLGVGTFAAGFDQRRIHQRGAFDDVAAGFQLRVEQGQQFFMQVAFDEPLPKPADRRFIGHGFLRVQLHKLLKAQPVLELFLGLRVAQTVKMLQYHYAQQHADAAGGASAVAVSGGHARLGLGEIHFLRDGFQHAVGRAALLHSQIKEGGLVLAFGLHGSLM